MIFSIHGRQTVGGRSSQQDSWRVRSLSGQDMSVEAARNGGVSLREGCLVVVCDGVGGATGGAVASAIACDVLTDTFFDNLEDGPEKAFDRAIEDVDAALAKKTAGEPELEGMGTTLVAGYFDADNGQVQLASIGDSLILRLRSAEIHVLNAEHNYGVQLDEIAFATGAKDDWDKAAESPRYMITEALTGKSHDTQHHCATGEKGDVFMFASDGLLTVMTHEHIRRFGARLIDKGQAGEIADRLVDAVDQLGFRLKREHDNATLVTVSLQAEEKTAPQ